MIRAFKEEDTETVIRIWLAASVRSHSFIDKAYWEEKAEAMRTLYLPLSEIVVDEDRTTGEVVAFMAFVEDYLAALFVKEIIKCSFLSFLSNFKSNFYVCQVCF